MLKRTLIAITVVALLATSAQAYGPDPETGSTGGDNNNNGIKIHPIKMDIFWPFLEYQALDLCVIPVKMKVGVFVQIEKCKDRKIILTQQECGDIGKGSGDWPCYYGCENIKVRSNIDVKLGLKRSRSGGWIPADNKWSAAFSGGNDTVDGGTGWQTLEICVKAWQVNLANDKINATAGETVDVGTVTVTVKPNV
jgi:hypothetical protein